MWSSTEDREKAFSFHCESFEREREGEKKLKKKWREREKKRDQATALIQPSAIWPASLPLSPYFPLLSLLSFFLPYCVFHPFYLLFFFLFLWLFFLLVLISDRQQRSEENHRVYGEFTSSVRSVFVRGGLCWKANEEGLCGDQRRFFRFSFNIPTTRKKKRERDCLRSFLLKQRDHKTPTQTVF